MTDSEAYGPDGATLGELAINMLPEKKTRSLTCFLLQSCPHGRPTMRWVRFRSIAVIRSKIAHNLSLPLIRSFQSSIKGNYHIVRTTLRI